MAKVSVKIVSILLMLVVAVKAQDFFQNSEETSVPSESGFSNDFEVTPSEPESFQDSEETNLLFETQEESHSDETSESSESKLSQVSEEDITEPLKTHQTPPPAVAPSPPKAPYPPKRPQNSCGKMCSTKCVTKKIPILHNLCSKICRQKCIVLHVQAIYKCTNHCAESMPKNFKSDKKKAAEYVKNCYHKCINKY